MSNTRFTNSILHSGQGSLGLWARDLPMGMSPNYVLQWDDFTGVAINSTNDWTVVKDSSATVALVADTAGGEVALTSAATTDADGASIQGNEIFLPAAGRIIWVAARIKSSLAAQNPICMGLTENFATNPEAMLTSSNRICFQVDDESGALICKTEIADTETSTTTSVSLADATYATLGIRIEGVTKVQFFVNNALVATHTSCPATELALGLMSISGSATGTRVVTCDYIMAAATR